MYKVIRGQELHAADHAEETTLHFHSEEEVLRFLTGVLNHYVSTGWVYEPSDDGSNLVHVLEHFQRNESITYATLDPNGKGISVPVVIANKL